MGLNIPAFFGYFNAHRGLMSNQVALNTINNNIANVNTPGYSRQRIDIESATPYPPASMSNYIESGQLGQGSRIIGISRSHDNLLDSQIRTQNINFGYQDSSADVLKQIEDIMGEPSDYGISASLSKFFSAAQKLSLYPDDMAIRTSFMEEAKNLLENFQLKANQLQELRTGLVGDPTNSSTLETSKVYLTVEDINGMLSDIATLNEQIIEVDAAGGTPNDLLDRRDQILNTLSENLNITVNYESAGQVDVMLGTNYLVKGTTLINSLVVEANTNTVPPDPVQDDVPALIGLTSSPPTAASNLNSIITGGKLGGILALGSNAAGTTTVRSVMENLNTLFVELAEAVNDIQSGVDAPPAPYTGVRDLNGDVPVVGINDTIFDPPAPSSQLEIFGYAINSDVLEDPALITAAYYDPTVPFPAPGTFSGSDGRNGARMAALQNQAIAALGNLTVEEYYKNQISNLGTATKSADQSAENLENVIQQLEQRRQSLQGVNLEEEMMDMMRYQRGFEASSKILSILDKIMDRIINGII